MLIRPDGSAQAWAPSCGGGTFLDRQTLTMAGTYTLLVDPVLANTGSADVTLYSIVDVTGPIVANGAAVPVSITAPGQQARLTFSGTAGQVVSAFTSNSTIPGNCFSFPFVFSIVKPDGSTLVQSASCNGNVALTQRTLPTSGTYTIVVDPTGANTGSVTVTLTSS
jgi:large repetitive protein